MMKLVSYPWQQIWKDSFFSYDFLIVFVLDLHSFM